MSAQVKQAVLEVEEYIRRENWPAIPHDIMKVITSTQVVHKRMPCECKPDWVQRLTPEQDMG